MSAMQWEAGMLKQFSTEEFSSSNSCRHSHPRPPKDVHSCARFVFVFVFRSSL